MNFFTQSRKNINKITVKQAAEHLMLTNGVTSSLEVKNHLRQQGYLAFQNEISEMMDAIAEENQWHFEFNGVFRLYAFRWEMDFATAWGMPKFSMN